MKTSITHWLCILLILTLLPALPAATLDDATRQMARDIFKQLI